MLGSGAAATGLLATSQYGSSVGKVVQCNFIPKRVQMWLPNHCDLSEVDSIWGLVVRDGLRVTRERAAWMNSSLMAIFYAESSASIAPEGLVAVEKLVVSFCPGKAAVPQMLSLQ